MSTDAKTNQISSLLHEFGSAIRGDWGNIDGRSIRNDLDNLASWVKAPESMPDIETCRRWMGVCPSGMGHWIDWCDDDCAKETT